MRCLCFYLIGFVLLLFVSCECNKTKEVSSLCHFVEEYRNMYYNEISPADSVFFVTLIEEENGISSLFLIGTQDVIPTFVQRPPLPDSIGEFCDMIDHITNLKPIGNVLIKNSSIMIKTNTLELHEGTTIIDSEITVK